MTIDFHCQYHFHAEEISTFRFLRRLIAPANANLRGRAKKTGPFSFWKKIDSFSFSIRLSTALARSDGDSS